MKTRTYSLLILIVSMLSFATSCGVSKMKDSDMTIRLSDQYSTMDIANTLNNNGYQLVSSNSNVVTTDWKKTNIELATFKVEVTQKVGYWELKGKIKYEAYRDREMDSSVYTEEYVYPNSDVFVIKYGWDMLIKIQKDLEI